MKNFDDRDGFIWHDGKMVPWRDAKIHVLTHTLHYGLGAFEGIRAYSTSRGPAVFRLEEHIHRLFDSAKILNMDMPYDKKTLIDACKDVVRLNKLESAYIRPLCFLGSEAMGIHASSLKTHVAVAAWEWGAYLGEEKLRTGITAKTSSIRRINVNTMFSKAKACGHYLNSMLALQEAKANGADEALMLDHYGFIAEGSGENFFMVKNGSVYTPLPGCILEGITRETIMVICRDLGIPCLETNISRDSVYTCDEAFFSGTAAEITPVRELDGRVIGNGSRGPITEKIQSLYFDYVHGRRTDHAEWLSFVS